MKLAFTAAGVKTASIIVLALAIAVPSIAGGQS